MQEGCLLLGGEMVSTQSDEWYAMYDQEGLYRQHFTTGRFIAHPRNYRPQGFQFGAWSEEMTCTPEREDWTQTGWKDYLGRIERRRAEIRGLRERSLSREPEDLPLPLHCVTKPTFKLNEILLLGGGVLVLFILTSN